MNVAADIQEIQYNHFKSARHKNAMKIIEEKNQKIKLMEDKLNAIKQNFD